MTGLRDFNILDYGAMADGRADDAAAIQGAIDACASAGGGRVIVPTGHVVVAGHIELRSHVEFHVEHGACLVSATTLDAFPRRVFDQGDETEKRLWIGCRDAVDVTLSGSGTIDGRCRAFALEENDDIVFRTHAWRPAMTCLENVRRLRIHDLTIRNSANWTLHFTGCRDVVVRNVKIYNDLKFPNADGIDPDHCRQVTIEDCHIVSADDCICLKNTAAFSQYGLTEDIIITRCRLESASAAFKIGSESVDDFRRVRMTECAIERSNRGLAIQLRDKGNVEDLEFRDITVGTRRFAPAWWGAGEPIYVTALPRQPDRPAGAVRNVRFTDIRCRGENGIVIYGDPAGSISNITFGNVRLDILRETPWPSGLFDLRPHGHGLRFTDGTPAGDDSPWGRPVLRPCAALSVEGADAIDCRGLVTSLPVGDSVPWTTMREPLPGPGESEPVMAATPCLPLPATEQPVSGNMPGVSLRQGSREETTP